MSRTKNIKVLTTADKRTFKAFADVHCLTKDNLKDDLHLSDRRITAMQKDGYIEEKSYFNTHTKQTEKYFVLTKQGKELALEKIDNIRYCYSSNSAQHDLKLSNEYFKLTPTEQDRWITETEQRELFAHSGGSPCDGGYVSESTGQLVLIEIVTQNYSKEMREQKVHFAQAKGATYKEIRS